MMALHPVMQCWEWSSGLRSAQGKGQDCPRALGFGGRAGEAVCCCPCTWTLGSLTCPFVPQRQRARRVSTTYFLSCAFLPQTAEWITFMGMGCFPGHTSGVSSQYGLLTSLFLKLHSAEQSQPLPHCVKYPMGSFAQLFSPWKESCFKQLMAWAFEPRSRRNQVTLADLWRKLYRATAD